MTKYAIKLISEVHFEFDYEGALKNSCVPEDYPDEIKALIMEEAKKLSDKNFYVGYCNERRGPVSWCNSSEELKEGRAGFVGAVVGQLDFTDEEMRSIREETKGMSFDESSAFIMNKYQGRFGNIRAQASFGSVKNAAFGVAGGFTPEDIEKMTASGCFIPATEEEKTERSYKLPRSVGNLYDNTFWGMLPAKIREGLHNEFYSLICTDTFMALVKKLSPEEEKEVLTHMEWIECMVHLSDIIEYLKENKVAPFNKPLETPVENTGENNE